MVETIVRSSVSWYGVMRYFEPGLIVHDIQYVGHFVLKYTHKGEGNCQS